MDKQKLIQLIREEIVQLLSEEKKHAMYDPETGKKQMADGELHKKLAAKGHVHFDPKKVVDAINKEGGAAGLDAIIKHTGADKEELEKSILKIDGVAKHSKGDYITVKSDRQVAEEIIHQEIHAVLDEKRRKKSKKRRKKSKGKKDSCYYKVKARYKVWPSAYASGALVRCRKVGAKNWGNKSKKKK